VIASTAAHFLSADDYPTFRIAQAIQQGTLLDRLPAVLDITPDHALIPAAELRKRFADWPEAIRAGEQLADQLRSDVLPRDLVLPRPHRTQTRDLTSFLRGLCKRGLRERQCDHDAAARQRLREELAIAEEAGLSGYFLTVRDIARMARRRGHTMALRGSAGNSLICYLLGITDVDPIRFNLPAERFLHAGRVDLPDIDLDFDWKVRDEIIDQVIQRHGPAHVARISSHLTLQPKAAFRQAAKAHGLSDEQISRLLTTLDSRVEGLLGSETVGSLPTFPLGPERWPRLVADARRLLGRPSYLSLHPGGVVITPGPIEERVPLQWAAKGVVMTQLDKDGVERIGLVKIDLLGNRALAMVDEARRHAGVPAAPPDEESATVNLVRTGNTLGVVQLESPAMRHLLVQLRVKSVDDVILALALVRPGAAGLGGKESFVRRRQGWEPVPVSHPILDAVLGETHGLLVYEDDTLRVLQALTGLDAPAADHFRRRVAKHAGPEEGAALCKDLIALGTARGVPAEVMNDLWPQLGKFTRYSFCKSHAVSYGQIAWRAAYLKTHYPLAFWTAALNNNQGCYPRRVYIEAVKRAGLTIRLPCLNRSQGPFTPEDGAIRTGLEAIAGLAEELRETLLEERARNGPYRDLADVRRRVKPGREALASLIRCGALDFTGRTRPALFLEADLRNAVPPAGELFATDLADGWKPVDYPDRRRWRDEWQLLGFVAGPPLLSLFPRPNLPPKPPLVTSDRLADYAGRLVRVRGLVATARHAVAEDGGQVQFVTLEDEHGLNEVTLFPRVCPLVQHLTLGPYVATGTVEDRYGSLGINAQKFDFGEQGQ
jgi:DNA polymerase-3 subunit alpha/error-prone DNA polymerase